MAHILTQYEIVIAGNEKGELMLTDVMLRIFVANDRMGLYDK